jgi:hypothetical protein
LVVGITDRRFRRRRLGGEPVEGVVAEGDGGAGAGLARQHVAVGVVAQDLRAAVGPSGGREPVEAVGREGRGVAVGVREPRAFNYFYCSFPNKFPRLHRRTSSHRILVSS